MQQVEVVGRVFNLVSGKDLTKVHCCVNDLRRGAKWQLVKIIRQLGFARGQGIYLEPNWLVLLVRGGCDTGEVKCLAQTGRVRCYNGD